MALEFYDDTQTLFGADPLRTVISNGNIGGTDEVKIYIRNTDAAKYYTNVQLQIFSSPMTNNGWNTKLMYGERRPTEAEWDSVVPDGPLDLPDIGSSGGADTSTYHPVWVRVHCPGNEVSQYRENESLRLYYFERNV